MTFFAISRFVAACDDGRRTEIGARALRDNCHDLHRCSMSAVICMLGYSETKRAELDVKHVRTEASDEYRADPQRYESRS